LNIKSRKGFGNEKLITQKLDYNLKMKYFKESLKKKEQNQILNDLYNDTIKIYTKQPYFEFLINIFINVYENKDTCNSLLEEFQKFNKKLTPKLDDPFSSFIVFKESLNEYIDKFKKNVEESKKIIESNSYDFIQFYGLIFSYLNHYDYDSCMKLFNDLEKTLESKNDLFEILLVYNHFFKKKLNLEKNFLENFITYSAKNEELELNNDKNNDNNNDKNNDKNKAKKHYLRFIQKALPYLDDINCYLHCLNLNKENIIKIKEFQPIEILKFQNYPNETEDLEKDIEEILDFSEEKNILMIYLNNDFWTNLSKVYEEVTQENIKRLKQLRILSEKYFQIVEKICKSKLIKTKAKEYRDRDELTIKLDRIIIDYIKNNNDISNDEIVNLLTEYDPYYDINNNNKIYMNKRNPEILEKLVLKEMNNEFIEDYKKKNFEKIFEQQMPQYMLTMISKIEKLSDFLIILELFEINKITDKKNDFIGLLEQKYNLYVNKINEIDDESLKESENRDMIQNLSKLIYFFYKETGLDSFTKKVKRLNQPILIVEILIILYKKKSDEENLELKAYII